MKKLVGVVGAIARGSAVVVCAAGVFGAGAGEAEAESKEPAAKVIQLELTDRLGVKATVQKSYRACRIDAGGWVQPVVGGVLADGSGANRQAESFLRAILQRQTRSAARGAPPSVECTTKSAAGGAAATWETMSVLRPSGVSALRDKGTSRIPMLAPSYAFPMEDPLVAVAGEVLLSESPTCALNDAAGKKLGDCRVDQTESSFKIAPSGATSIPEATAAIVLAYKGNKAVTLPIATCDLTLDGEVNVLVQGARKQRVTIAFPQDADVRCDAQLWGVRTIKEGDVSMHAAPVSMGVGGRGMEVDIEPISEKLSPGPHRLELLSAAGTVGRLTATVVDPIQTASKVHVRFDVRNGGGKPDPSFLSASGETEGFLVVNPDRRAPALVTNSVELRVPATIPLGLATGDRATAAKLAKAADVGRQGLPEELWAAEAVSTQMAWRVVSTPLADLAVQGCVTGPTLGEPWGTSNCLLTSRLDALTVSALSVSPAAVSPILSLERITTMRVLDPGSPVDCQLHGTCIYTTTEVRETVLETRVKIAEGARVESVPLPVREALQIVCKEAHMCGPLEDGPAVSHDETRAMDDDALGAGKCSLGVKKGYDLSLYGPQAMIVTVQQRGGQKLEQALVLSTKNPTSTLPAPTGDVADGKVYDIEVRLTNKAPSLDGAVHYRTGALDPVPESAQVSRGETQFVAHLRPHGRFGTGNISEKFAGIRTYFTVAAELGGIRFPASGRELKNTSQPTSYQLVAPRPGILFTLEPWNYDTAQNPLRLGVIPLPIAFQAGFHLTKITEDDVAVSLIAGGSFNVPLIEGAPSQLGTSVGLGLYYENDLRGGNYFLMTFGFKLGSLLSGATK
ncbi:MAG: hypothetical protein R3B70_24535 [Polyangiaceae bacterium]